MDEEKIYDLYINQHLTTQQIADQLGYNRNGVKNFIYKRGWKRRFIKKCVVCGKEFETDRERNKFCSEECHKKQVAKDDVKYHRPKSGMRVCENCGKEYHYNENVPSYYKSENQKTGVNAARFCCYECGREFGWKKEQKTNLEKYGHECSAHGEEIKEKVKKTLIEKYGVEYTFQSEEIKEKIRQTNLEKYSVDNILKLDEFKRKARETNLKKYGTENVFANEEIKKKIKETNLKKYGTEYALQSEKIKQKYDFFDIARKLRETKKKNNSFNTSTPEKNILDLLKFKFNDVKTEYKSELYPFSCDFYIPELDLYLEYQGIWTHGKEPFVETEEQLIKLSKWKEKGKTSKFYRNAIEVWTISDPLKRETAHKNKLNWIEFFTFNDFMKWYDTI